MKSTSFYWQLSIPRKSSYTCLPQASLFLFTQGGTLFFWFLSQTNLLRPHIGFGSLIFVNKLGCQQGSRCLPWQPMHTSVIRVIRGVPQAAHLVFTVFRSTQLQSLDSIGGSTRQCPPHPATRRRRLLRRSFGIGSSDHGGNTFRNQEV